MSLRILITNDDGVDAPGIAVMEEIARDLSDDIWVCAPDGNQSGAAHRFTFGRELELIERRNRVFAVPGGSPADCVVAGMTFLLGDRPADLVLSGVNNGQNLGDIVNCSGTAAGAREGALQGAVGIAMSQGVDYEKGVEIDWGPARAHAASVARSILDQGKGQGAWFNVNFPFCSAEEVAGVRVVPTQRFARSPMRYYASDNRGKFFIAIPETPTPLDPAHDFHLLMHERMVTVTPVTLQATDHELARRMNGKVVLSK
ncbi:MAG: 5'/3'-nucleotidase SurE [Devosia sp.]